MNISMSSRYFFVIQGLKIEFAAVGSSVIDAVFMISKKDKLNIPVKMIITFE